MKALLAIIAAALLIIAAFVGFTVASGIALHVAADQEQARTLRSLKLTCGRPRTQKIGFVV